jgi:Glyoxalase-like domain
MQIAFDCADPAALAAFWVRALPGYQVQPPPPGFDSWEAFLEEQQVPKEDWNSRSAVVGDGPRLFFQRVPESKTVKNRVHLDLHAGGGPAVPVEEQRANVRTEVARLQAHGATFVEEREELGVVWAVMTDPEGNEFCA